MRPELSLSNNSPVLFCPPLSQTEDELLVPISMPLHMSRRHLARKAEISRHQSCEQMSYEAKDTYCRVKLHEK